MGPIEKTYVFKPSQVNYNDGSENTTQALDPKSQKSSFLQEITKLSQLNISRLNNRCSYTVLSASATDSTESLLKQHASPPGEVEEISTPTRGSMVKSKSAYVIKKRNDISPEDPKDVKQKRKVEFSCNKMTREPISVPNFSLLTLPTPVLTPVEAARLVFLDSEDEDQDDNEVFVPPVIDVKQVRPSSPVKDFFGFESFKTVKYLKRFYLQSTLVSIVVVVVVEIVVDFHQKLRL